MTIELQIPNKEFLKMYKTFVPKSTITEDKLNDLHIKEVCVKYLLKQLNMNIDTEYPKVTDEDIENDNYDTGDFPNMTNKQLIRALEITAYQTLKAVQELRGSVNIADVGSHTIYARFLDELRKRLHTN